MKLNSGYPFWLIRDGLPFTYPKLDKDISCDLLILGGGISGALVRYSLIQAGLDPVLIDGRTIGLGSTCASTALLQYEIDTPLHQLREMIGIEKADRAFHLCNQSITDIASIANKIGHSDFEYKDSLYFAAYKKDVPFLKKEFEARKQAGFNVKWIDEKEVRDAFGFSSPAAILSHHGAQLDAYAFAHSLLQQCPDCRIFDRTPVVQVDHHDKGVTLTTASGNTIKCKTLIYATGYEVEQMLGPSVVKLLSTYAVISEQYNKSDFWNDGTLLWNTADPYLYLRTTSDGRILIGGRDVDFYNPAKRDKMLPKKVRQLTSDFQKLFPDKAFIPEFSWTGTFGSTKDGLPYIGKHPDYKNAYFALGFGGNGITFSQVAAVILADILTGRENPDVDLFSFGR
ncbi:NAD(P)/FAD-dependent oxidoreductase [Flavobacterium silvaticum]|uniref:FAD-binding oxidoreductase n=1 Tax=Flavobacterium silvaticum TaxID=1852020 RepID=A0A972FSS7_9FLAO|nr:FAD-binding oxidoreductase [Flavobacterium silvaticum]NMH27337.1 FAD-binding oxidoreductase [Flavobacterium silvaticum]